MDSLKDNPRLISHNVFEYVGSSFLELEWILPIRDDNLVDDYQVLKHDSGLHESQAADPAAVFSGGQGGPTRLLLALFLTHIVLVLRSVNLDSMIGFQVLSQPSL